MTVMNELDRFHLVIDACNKIENECKTVKEQSRWTAVYVKQEMEQMLIKHKNYIREFGVDMDEITSWRWDE